MFVQDFVKGRAIERDKSFCFFTPPACLCGSTRYVVYAGAAILRAHVNAKARSNVGTQQGRNRQRYIKQGENTNMRENTDKEEDEWAKKKGKGIERG